MFKLHPTWQNKRGSGSLRGKACEHQSAYDKIICVPSCTLWQIKTELIDKQMRVLLYVVNFENAFVFREQDHIKQWRVRVEAAHYFNNIATLDSNARIFSFKVSLGVWLRAG